MKLGVPPGEKRRRLDEARARNKRALARWAVTLSAPLSLCAGCAHRHYPRIPPAAPPAPPSSSRLPPPGTQSTIPGQYVEEGVASWYGVPFNGHRTSNGEIYDMYQMTAAHRTLPFGALIRVTNLLNGKQTQVRINDRGPFVANRDIDLSLAAAQAIDLVGPGTAPVRLELLEGSNPAEGVFGVQVGAFLLEDNAQKLRERLSAQYSPVNVVPYDSPYGYFYRVRVGRLATEELAHQLAERLRMDRDLTTFVVRLDE